jgi:hypothetical protein
LTSGRVVTDYLTVPLPSVVWLAIMGKDPFPRGATGIPFIKGSWDEQKAHNCAGRYLLEGLGVDLSRASLEFCCPLAFAFALRETGTIFLNAAYVLLDGDLRKGAHLHLLEAAYLQHRDVLRVAEKVVLCGQASKARRWVSAWVQPCLEVVHPDQRNSNSNCARVKDEWHRHWMPGALPRALRITLGLPC